MRRAQTAEKGRRIIRCQRCQRMRPHNCRGYCQGCYNVVRAHERRGTTPPPFGTRRPWTPEDIHYLETLLRDADYTIAEAAEWLGRGVHATRKMAERLGLPLRGDHLIRRRRVRIAECARCRRMRPHRARGLCTSCYAKAHRRQRIAECARCGRERPHKAHGLCASCYELERTTSTGRVVECRCCGRSRPHKAHGLCRTCYSTIWAREKRARQRQEASR